MDGVLIEAKDWHCEALNRALEHFGYTISRKVICRLLMDCQLVKLKILTKSRQLPEGLHGAQFTKASYAK